MRSAAAALVRREQGRASRASRRFEIRTDRDAFPGWRAVGAWVKYALQCSFGNRVAQADAENHGREDKGSEEAVGPAQLAEKFCELEASV